MESGGVWYGQSAGEVAKEGSGRERDMEGGWEQREKACAAAWVRPGVRAPGSARTLKGS